MAIHGAPHGGSLNAAAPQPLRAILDAIDRLGRIDGWLGALCLVLLTTLIFAEVLVRFLSGFLPWVPAHIPVAWEYGSYLMAATFTFGAAMTLRAGGHIRVTLLTGNASPVVRRGLEIFCALAATIFVGFLAYAMIKFALGSYQRGTTSISSNTPIWIPQAVVAFGMLLLAMQALARLIQACLGLPLENPDFKPASGME